MLLSNNKEQALLAGTGITKAGHLLKQQANTWKSYFVLLNDHVLTFCSSGDDKRQADAYMLLTPNTRVYGEDAGAASLFRVETGYEVLILKGKTKSEISEWKRAIDTKVDNLTSLARGQFRVTCRGRSSNLFMMLHSECITSHKNVGRIAQLFPLEESTFVDKGSYICFRSGSTQLKMRAKTAMEHEHWVYALNLNRKQSDYAMPSPLLPLHAGSLEFLDLSTMHWSTQYVVLTETCLYTHDHRKIGTPRRYALSPNSMLYETNLDGRWSFELVLFSDVLHLSTKTKVEQDEWMSMLKDLIPKSNYDCTDILQLTALERDVDVVTVSFDSLASPGVCLQERGNWAVATIVSEQLTTVSPGSVLSSIDGNNVILDGFDNAAKCLCLCNAPLQVSFWHSPRKMGWLNLVSSKRSSSFWSRRPSWMPEVERVYATLYSGKLSLYVVKRQGKSTKSILKLTGASVGLADNNCFNVYSGLQIVKLQAVCREEAIDWATKIAHGISMENGGGVLLDKEKKAVMRRDASSDWESPAMNDGWNSCPRATTIKSDEIQTKLGVTEMTDELSSKMEEFDRNFFLPTNNVLSVNQEWLEIDRASRIASEEEIFESYSDIDNFHHVNSQDYSKLQRWFALEAKDGCAK